MGPLEDPPLYSANCQKERREDGTRTRIKSLAHFPFEQDFLNSTLAGATYRLARLFHARGTASNCRFITPCIHLTMENQGQLIPTTRLEKDFPVHPTETNFHTTFMVGFEELSPIISMDYFSVVLVLFHVGTAPLGTLLGSTPSISATFSPMRLSLKL